AINHHAAVASAIEPEGKEECQAMTKRIETTIKQTCAHKSIKKVSSDVICAKTEI
ncbi:6604_t:CDS:1, partial [Ambispora gerdemannii]